MTVIRMLRVKTNRIPVEDSGFKYGWHCGFKWIKENYHIDAHGNPNCAGDFLKHFQDLSGNEIIGVKEGVTHGLSFLYDQLKSKK